MMSILGIIPARGGSKRLPGKNLKTLGGKSLIRIACEQAKKALPVSVVTTDYYEIILEALSCGVKSLLRPSELATDQATTKDVVKHVLETYPGFDWFCLLQPTSPLRSVEDITNCIELAKGTGQPVHSTYQGKPNGAVYVGRWNFETFNGLHYEMPWERSIDIDTQHDLDEAEAILGHEIRTSSTGKVLL